MARTRIDLVGVVSWSRTAAVRSEEPLIEKEELSLPPVPVTRVKACVSPASGSTALSVPTTVPAGLFSETAVGASVRSVGASFGVTSHRMRWLVPVPPSHSSRAAPPLRTSSPAPPRILSACRPPSSRSLPDPPEIRSAPRQPSTRSLPLPPRILSSPDRPQIRSSPPRALIRSSPRPATITSRPLVPRMTSSPGVPTIVAAAPRQSRSAAAGAAALVGVIAPTAPSARTTARASTNVLDAARRGWFSWTWWGAVRVLTRALLKTDPSLPGGWGGYIDAHRVASDAAEIHGPNGGFVRQHQTTCPGPRPAFRRSGADPCGRGG